MIKKFTSLILAGIFSLVSVCICGCRSDESGECLIINEQSFLSDVQTDGEKVYYSCHLTVKNNLEKDITVEFIGDFSEEYDLGIIDEKSLIASNEAGEQAFRLKAEETVGMDISFTGTKKNKAEESDVLKTDRILPSITVKTLS